MLWKCRYGRCYTRPARKRPAETTCTPRSSLWTAEESRILPEKGLGETAEFEERLEIGGGGFSSDFIDVKIFCL